MTDTLLTVERFLTVEQITAASIDLDAQTRGDVERQLIRRCQEDGLDRVGELTVTVERLRPAEPTDTEYVLGGRALVVCDDGDRRATMVRYLAGVQARG